MSLEDDASMLRSLRNIAPPTPPDTFHPRANPRPPQCHDGLVPEGIQKAATDAGLKVHPAADIRDRAGFALRDLSAEAARDDADDVVPPVDLQDVRRIAEAFASTRPPARIAAKMSSAEAKAYNARWGAERARIEGERTTLMLSREAISNSSLVESFGAAAVEGAFTLGESSRIRPATDRRYQTFIRDYVSFCAATEFSNYFLEGLSDTAAAVVIILFLQHQYAWRGHNAIKPSSAALHHWFNSNHVPAADTLRWFEGPRVKRIRQELALLVPGTTQVHRRVEHARRLISIDYLWMALSIFGTIYGPGEECPFLDSGRHERMMVTALFFMFAYCPRPANVVYTSNDTLDQLLTELTIFFRITMPGSEITEVIFAHQFDSMSRHSWFTPAVCSSICIMAPNGKTWGIDKPGNSAPWAFSIVEGRSHMSNLLIDLMFQQASKAHLRKGDIFFSLNSIRVHHGRTCMDNRKLTACDMNKFMKILAVLLGEDPTGICMYSIKSTAATTLATTAAQELAGSGYFKSLANWTSKEAPRGYVHPDMRPVNALDVPQLSARDLQNAAMPRAPNTAWKAVVDQELQQRWPNIVATARARMEATRDAYAPERSSVTISAQHDDADVFHAPSAHEHALPRSASVIPSATGPEAHLPTVSLTVQAIREYEEQAVHEAACYNSARTNVSSYDTDHAHLLGYCEIEIEDADPREILAEARQIEMPSVQTARQSDALRSPHRCLSDASAVARDRIRAAIEIGLCAGEPSGLLLASTDEEYRLLADCERLSPSRLDWKYVTIRTDTLLPLIGPEYTVVLVAPMGRDMWVTPVQGPHHIANIDVELRHPSKRDRDYRFRNLESLGGQGALLQRPPPHARMDDTLEGSTVVRSVGNYDVTRVGSITSDGLIRGAHGDEVANPNFIPGASYFAIHEGVYGRTPVVTQSAMYTRILTHTVDPDTGDYAVSYPFGTVMKNGFKDYDQAMLFAREAIDARPIDLALNRQASHVFENRGWIVFYGGVRHGEHPYTGQVVERFVTTDPTVFKLLFMEPGFVGATFMTFQDARSWADGDDSIPKHHTPFSDILKADDPRVIARGGLPSRPSVSLVALRYETGHRPVPIPGQPGWWHAGLFDESRSRFPAFPTWSDKDSEEYDGSSTVYSSQEAVARHLSDPGTQSQSLLYLISRGLLPATCFDVHTFGWAYKGEHSNPESFPGIPTALEDDLPRTQIIEAAFQHLVDLEIIQDLRDPAAASSSAAWTPAVTGMSPADHAQVIATLMRLRENDDISQAAFEALLRRYPESLIDKRSRDLALSITGSSQSARSGTTDSVKPTAIAPLRPGVDSPPATAPRGRAFPTPTAPTAGGRRRARSELASNETTRSTRLRTDSARSTSPSFSGPIPPEHQATLTTASAPPVAPQGDLAAAVGTASGVNRASRNGPANSAGQARRSLRRK